MDDNLDNEILISLIQNKPVLWDKTLPIYKDRNATKNAWKDVCCEINTNFEDMEDKEKSEFGKAVIRRWTNLRDAFSKSKRKQQDFKKSGSAAPNIKKYVYNNQMQFLNKVYELRETVDSLSNTHNSEDGLANNDELQPASDANEGVVHNQVTNKEKMAERFGNRKRRKPDEIELRMLKALEPEKPNSHMSFFQGVIPHLNKFDDSEVLEFQIGVLRVISTINEKKRTSQPSTFPYHPQRYSVPQPPSFPNPQPSCSSYFNLSSTYQSPFSQQLQSFDSQNNPIPNPNNQKHRTEREPPVAQHTQSAAQYYHDFSQSSAATSPDIYSTGNASPAPSGSSENTIDFTTLNSI